jgi:hypothetical protein
MRTLFAFLFVGFVGVGCSDTNQPISSADPSSSPNSKSSGEISAAGPGFTFELLSSNVYDATENGGLGGYVWEWKVTINDAQEDPLNHVVVQLGDCVDMSHLVGGYNFNNQADKWQSANIKIGEDDNSMGCDDNTNPSHLVTVPNVGSPVGYFRLVFSTNVYVPQDGLAFWKSSNACGQTTFYGGVGCDDGPGGQGDEDGCSYSQGFYLASPVSAGDAYPGWGGINGGTVTVGGYVYTEAEARAIFRASNKGGIADAKFAFQQAVAIKLSGAFVYNTDVWDWVDIIDNYLSGYPKLTPTNIGSNKSRPSWVWNTDIKTAGSNISTWINEHHCDDNPPQI